MKHSVPDEELKRISDALLSGHKIAAIKIYRELTGEELAESKAAVEEIEAKLRVQSPEKFSRKIVKVSGPGGALVLIAGAALIITIVWLLIK